MFTKGGKPDLLVFIAVIALLSIGLVMVFSASSVMGLADYGNPYHYVHRQSILALVGLVLMFILMRVDYHIFRPLALPGLLISFALLILVLFVGTGTGGATRWIRLPGFNLQPSEVAKLIMVNYVAVYLSHKRENTRKFFSGLLPILLFTGAQFALIMLEPDFGTGGTIVAVSLMMLFAAGARSIHLLSLAALGVPGLVVMAIAAPYRARRFLAFLDPWEDPLGSGFHIIQSLLALGSGGLFGVGLGRSRQKFLYLPMQHTDFIFAIIGEELGFTGAAMVLIFYFLFAWRGLRIAIATSDAFGKLLAVGITTMIVFQAIINIGVVSGVLPITGITLPLISSGGSSLVTTLAAIGVLLNISKHSTLR